MVYYYVYTIMTINVITIRPFYLALYDFYNSNNKKESKIVLQKFINICRKTSGIHIQNLICSTSRANRSIAQAF